MNTHRFPVAGFWGLGLLALICLTTMAVTLIHGTGNDYAYFLPRLLDIYLFYQQNGLTHVEYSLSYCAGMFVFANPQSLALSLPQLLIQFINPITAIRATFVIISMMGAVAMYLIARKLKQAPAQALVSAAVATFSGFFICRMMMGHLGFHSFGLIAVAAAAMLLALEYYRDGKWPQACASCSAAALCIAYFVVSGAFVLLPVIALMLGFLVMLYGLVHKRVMASLVVLAITAALSLALAAAKIEAILSLMSNFERNYYTLPGFNATGLLQFIAQGIFYEPSTHALNEHLLNRKFFVGWNGFYIGLTPVAAALLSLPLLSRNARHSLLSMFSKHRAAAVFCLLFLVFPLALIYYTPDWNAFLKSLPVINQSSNLIRWSAALIPLIALACGLMSGFLTQSANMGAALVAAVMIAMSAFHIAVAPDGVAKRQHYQPSNVIQAWQQFENGKSIPVIEQVGVIQDKDARGQLVPRHSPTMDHFYLTGWSNAMCYEPVFGYRLEKFPFGELSNGPIENRADNGDLNMKNPACYVYPEANNCKPGDHFKHTQLSDMVAMARHSTVSFASSNNRKLASTIQWGALVLCVVALLLPVAASHLRRASTH